LAWEILNVFAMYRMGFWWVLYPFPCDVLAVYLLGTLALAPSETRPQSSRVPHRRLGMVQLSVNILVPVEDPHHHQATINRILDFCPILATEFLRTTDHVHPQGVVVVQIKEGIPLPLTLIKTGLFTRNPLPVNRSLGDLTRNISIDDQTSRYGHPDLKEAWIRSSYVSS